MSLIRVLKVSIFAVPMVLSAFTANAAEVSRKVSSIQETVASSSSFSKPNSLTLELAGRGLLYSINYDRTLGDHVALGAGLSYFKVNFGETFNIAIVPLYLNTYLLSGHHRPFITAGADFAFADHTSTTATDENNNSTTTYGGPKAGFAPVVGFGYEYRAADGFLLRAAPYAMIGDKVVFTFGLSFGGTF